MIPVRPSPARTRQVRVNANGNGGVGIVHLINKIFTRLLDQDLVAYDKNWLVQNNLQRQLEGEGYRLRWVSLPHVRERLREGWEYVTVPYHFWWRKRVRRPNRPQSQYLFKRAKNL